jgi:malonate decarboxylase beta subunit
MMDDAATSSRASWFQATARERIEGLLDLNSFTEFLPPSERIRSPHLQRSICLRHSTMES